MKKSLLCPLAGLCFLAQLLTSSEAAFLWPEQNQPNDTTLALFHFDEEGTIVMDSGPKGQKLTLAKESARSTEAPQWMSAPTGRFIKPSGNATTGTSGLTSNLEISDVDFNKGLTISFWYQPRPDERQGGELFQMEGPRVRLITDDYGAGNNGRIRLITPGMSPTDLPVMADSGMDAAWRHVAVVYDPLNGNAANGGSWTLYLDGQTVGTFKESNDLSQDKNITIRIAGNIWDNGPLEGVNLDEFLIANRVITDFANPAR